MRSFLIFGLLLLAGCSFYLGNEIPGPAEDGLKNADWAILYTLDPAKPVPGGRELDGFTVRDKVILVKGDAREAAADVEDALDSGNTAAGHCVFKPDHALRVRQDYHTYDFLLSYDCGVAEILEDHHEDAWHGINGSPQDLDAIIAADKIRPPANGK